MIPAKTPNAIKLLYPEYIWDFYDTKKKNVYLTFDDGPIPEVTPFVLDLLNKFDAKATFFCIGENIRKHPGIFKKIIDDGHSIGNHTLTHIKAWNSNIDEYINNILRCENLIAEVLDNDTKLFRPPYGQISKSKFKKLIELDYKIVLWDVLAKDWEVTTSPEKCAENIIQNSKNGSIVVFHDSMKAYKNLSYALPQALEHFSKRGYTFSKI